MAMTKAEKAQVDALRDVLAMTQVRYREPYAPTPIDAKAVSHTLGYGFRVAWTYNSSLSLDQYSNRATQGCFGHGHHSRYSTEKTTTQGLGGPWYETEIDALMACRDAMAVEAFKRLADLDAKITELRGRTDG